MHMLDGAVGDDADTRLQAAFADAYAVNIDMDGFDWERCGRELGGLNEIRDKMKFGTTMRSHICASYFE